MQDTNTSIHNKVKFMQYDDFMILKRLDMVVMQQSTLPNTNIKKTCIGHQIGLF